MPDTREEKYTRADRDLLIELKTQMGVVLKTSERLEQALGEIKDNVIGRVETLEKQKANETEILRIYDTRTPQWQDFNKRIESIERNKADAGALAEVAKETQKRLGSLENKNYWVAGAFSFIGVVMALVVYIYITDLSRMKGDLLAHEAQSEKQFDQLIQQIDNRK